MQRFYGTFPAADWNASTTIDDMLILQYWSIIFYLVRLSVTTPHVKFGITINCPYGKRSIERVDQMWCA